TDVAAPDGLAPCKRYGRERLFVACLHDPCPESCELEPPSFGATVLAPDRRGRTPAGDDKASPDTWCVARDVACRERACVELEPVQLRAGRRVAAEDGVDGAGPPEDGKLNDPPHDPASTFAVRDRQREGLVPAHRRLLARDASRVRPRQDGR